MHSRKSINPASFLNNVQGLPVTAHFWTQENTTSSGQRVGQLHKTHFAAWMAGVLKAIDSAQ